MSSLGHVILVEVIIICVLIGGLVLSGLKWIFFQPCGSMKLVGQWIGRHVASCSGALRVLRLSQRAISDFVLVGCGASLLYKWFDTFWEGDYSLHLQGFMELETLDLMVIRSFETSGRMLRTVSFQKTGIPLHVELKSAFPLFTLYVESLASRASIIYLLTYTFTNLITYLLTSSREQNPWEAYRFSASQEITRILWNSKVNYHS